MATEIDVTAIVSPWSLIQDSIGGTLIKIGHGTQIDAFVRTKPSGGRGNIVIGANCYLNSGTVLYSGHGISVGDSTLLAAHVVIAPINHAYENKSVPITRQGHLPSKGGVAIGSDVWIGVHPAILEGSVIPAGCVIGAASLARENLEPYCVYAGNPLKKLSIRT